MSFMASRVCVVTKQGEARAPREGPAATTAHPPPAAVATCPKKKKGAAQHTLLSVHTAVEQGSITKYEVELHISLSRYS